MGHTSADKVEQQDLGECMKVVVGLYRDDKILNKFKHLKHEKKLKTLDLPNNLECLDQMIKGNYFESVKFILNEVFYKKENID